jgi:predicted ATPase
MAERLIGRGWQLRALLDLLAAARAGRGRGLLLLGIGGIGKTTLAEALAAEAGDVTVDIPPIEHPFLRFSRLNPVRG